MNAAALPRFQKSWVQQQLFSAADFQVKRAACQVIPWRGDPLREARLAKAARKREQSAPPAPVLSIPLRRSRNVDDVLTPGDPDEALALVQNGRANRMSPPLVLPVYTMSDDPVTFIKHQRRPTQNDSDRPRSAPSHDKAAAALDADRPRSPRQS